MADTKVAAEPLLARARTRSSIRHDGFQEWDGQGSPPEYGADHTSALTTLFVVIGIGSAILWGQVMLSAEVLVIFFGKSALSSACLMQGVLCSVVMLMMTVWPQVPSRTTSLYICAFSFIFFAFVGAAIMYCFKTRWFPHPLFLILVGMNGVCTGFSQIQGASMSGLFSKISSSIPGGLILGEALAPLIAAAISVAVNARVSDTYTKAIIPLVFAEFFLLFALIACARLFNYNEPAQRPPPPVTCGTCQAEGGRTKEYVWRRVSEMSLNGFCGFFASAVWVYTMGSMPYMASGLCGANVDPTAEETQCAVSTPTFTVVASHVFCYIGRQIGTRFASMTERCYMMQTIFLECIILAVFGFYSVHWCKTGGFGTEDMLPQATHLAVGVTTIISGYANMLLIRLSYEAQKQCGHSVMFPCPVTTQITWVTRSFGSIGGVALSFYLNS